MTKNLFVSVVVCAFNEEKYLAKCLEALITQSYPADKYEIIVVDDESSDDTCSIANKFVLSSSACELSLKTIPHGGLSVARNAGIQLSKGDIIAFIDGDAIAANNWLENIAKEFAESNTPQIIGGPVHLLNKESKTASLLYNSIYSWELKPETAIIGTNMAFSRTLLADSPAFHPLFVSRGDESYVFEKLRLKYNILPRKVDSIIVDHESPESLKTWLKTRSQNGYYSVVIASLFRDEKSLYSYSKLLIGFISLLFPLLILLSFMIHTALLISFSLLILFFLLLVKRFIISGFMPKVIKEYYKNTNNKKKLSTILYLAYIVIIGTFAVEYGYLKGSVKFACSKLKGAN